MEWGCIKCGKEIPQYAEFCPECEEKQFRKIGGFLYLPLLGLIITATSYLFAMTQAFKVIVESYWHIIPEAKIFFVSSLLTYLAMFMLTIFTLSLFLRKKKSLPKVYMLFLILIIVTMSVNTYLLYRLIPGITIGYNELVPIFRNLITALIWIPYFRVSVRVKKTFVH